MGCVVVGGLLTLGWVENLVVWVEEAKASKITKVQYLHNRRQSAQGEMKMTEKKREISLEPLVPSEPGPWLLAIGNL